MARRFVSFGFIAGLALTLLGCSGSDTTQADITEKAKSVQQAQQSAQSKDGVKSE